MSFCGDGRTVRSMQDATNRFLISAVLTVAMLSPSIPAWSQEDAFDPILDQALADYRARLYVQAAEGFERAYTLRPEPELVYNQARAYEKALRRDESIQAYEHFLELVGTTAELRSRALASLTALRHERAVLQQAKQRATTPPPVDSVPPIPVATTVHPAPWIKPEYVLIGSGSIAAVVGGVFGVLAARANHELSHTKTELPADPRRLSDLEDEVRRNALVADILVGTGIVSAGIGVVLLLLDTEESGPTASIAPTANGSGAKLMLASSF